jgi:hypothetical protein
MPIDEPLTAKTLGAFHAASNTRRVPRRQRCIGLVKHPDSDAHQFANGRRISSIFDLDPYPLASETGSEILLSLGLWCNPDDTSHAERFSSFANLMCALVALNNSITYVGYDCLIRSKRRNR